MDTLKDQKNTLELILTKINFSINKRLQFGQAIYVCGNIQQLGKWRVKSGFRLKWNQNDLWTGSLLITDLQPDYLEFKYVIADWQSPQQLTCEWEVGSHNRRIQLSQPKKIIICDDKFNMDLVTMLLKVKKTKLNHEDMYYVVGDVKELGCWKERKVMKKFKRSERSFSHGQKKNFGLKHNVLSVGNSESNQDNMTTYVFSTHMFRGREKYHYYYIKKSQVYESERRPGRVLNLSKQHLPHPFREKVSHQKGDITIHDQLNLNELVFSSITNSILVGSYLKSPQDFARLKEQKITSILSIQSQRDYAAHGLSQHYLKLLCKQYGITHRRYSIQDMNSQDFISKAQGALRIMSRLIREGGKVYVHCSAGKYRSPQIIAMYLTIFEGYSLERAVQMLKERHPFARPNLQVVQQAMGRISFRRSKKSMVI